MISSHLDRGRCWRERPMTSKPARSQETPSGPSMRGARDRSLRQEARAGSEPRLPLDEIDLPISPEGRDSMAEEKPSEERVGTRRNAARRLFRSSSEGYSRSDARIREDICDAQPTSDRTREKRLVAEGERHEVIGPGAARLEPFRPRQKPQGRPVSSWRTRGWLRAKGVPPRLGWQRDEPRKMTR